MGRTPFNTTLTPIRQTARINPCYYLLPSDSILRGLLMPFIFKKLTDDTEYWEDSFPPRFAQSAVNRGKLNTLRTF